MKVITVLNFKGGTGKTFISVVLGELLMIAGKRAAVVDMDAQLTAVDALRRMDGGNVFPLLDVYASPGKAPDFAALRGRGYDFIVIDTPPQIIDNAPIQSVIGSSDVFIVPMCLQRHSLFGFEKTLELLPEGRPVLPVCSMGPQAKTRGKRELLELVREELGEGGGDLCPAVFLPWYDRVDENISARRDFFFLLRENEYACFERLRDSLFSALNK